MTRLTQIICLLLAMAASASVFAQAPQIDVKQDFYGALELTPLDGTAVWQEGRLKSFESAARRSRLRLRAANRQLISLIAFPAVGWGWLERDELAVSEAQAAVAAAR